MSLASEKLITAEGWSQFDIPDKEDNNQAYLDFAHKVAKVFKSREGKEVLDALVSKYLLVDIVSASDSQFAAGIKQGRASVVKQILAQIEVSNATK